MRKGVILLVIAILLLLPVSASAQAAVTLDWLHIQFWSDYDQPAVLVIYDFVLSADTSLPAQVKVRMPAGAQLLAVARQDTGGLMNLEHQAPQRQGDFDALTFTVSDRSQYHVEFYVPYVRDGQTRKFSYNWPGDYAVTTLKFVVQEPVGATGVQVEPAMSRSGPMDDGFVYQSISLDNIAAGEALPIAFSYEKADETLSSASLGVQPTAPLDQPLTTQSAFMTWLPWILLGLGIVLIIGGGAWYWFSGRAGVSRRSRKRHAAQEESPEEQVYCSQCGKRGQHGDRFCRACGAKLRAQE